jgi:hypothetical protein
MSRNLDARLAKLELALKPQPDCFVILRQIVNADGSFEEPVTLETSDGSHRWNRIDGETREDFERRVCEDASRFGRTVLLFSRDDIEL